MVIKVIGELGHKNVARRYLQFIVDLIPDKDEKLQIMYGINKEKKLTEGTLDHLAGYKGSQPVRIGNAAYKQRQNDIYGILMDVIYEQLAKYSNDIENGEELWGITKGIVWIVSKHWQEPDKHLGIPNGKPSLYLFKGPVLGGNRSCDQGGAHFSKDQENRTVDSLGTGNQKRYP